MVDFVEADPGTGGAKLAVDNDLTQVWPYGKVAWGADGVRTPVSSGASALPIQDGGNSITVDGTVTVQDGGNVISIDDAGATISIDDGGGSITVDGSVTATVSGTVAVTTGTTASDLGKVEDAAHTTGDVGVMVLAVRNDGGTTLAGTDGDYAPLSVDSSGRLRVHAQGPVNHDAVYAGSPVVTAAFASTATPTAVSADGDVAHLWCDLNGRLNIADGGGNISVDDGGSSITVDNGGTFAVQATVAAGATNIAKAEDVASADADVGVPAMAVRKATPANTSGTDGDYEMLQMSAGRLWVDASGVTLTVAAHAVTNAGTFAIQDSEKIADDAAFTVATSKVMPAGFMADESSTDSVDEGDAGIARMTLDRKVIVTQQPHTKGGTSMHQTISAASTNATVVKNAAGQVYGVQVSSINAAARYIKLYDKATAPTVGSDTPVKTLVIPGNAAGAGFVIAWPNGLEFVNGISFALTSGIAVADTGAVSASEHAVNIDYK